MQAYFNLGISTATRKAYTAGLRKYNTFCREINQPPITVCEDTFAAVHQKFGPTRSILCNDTSVRTSLQYDTVTPQLVSLLP